MNILEKIMSIIAPHECISCQNEGLLLCKTCQLDVAHPIACCYRCGRTQKGTRTCTACRATSPLYSVTAVTTYEGLSKDLVHALKFERKKEAHVVLAQMIAATITPHDYDCITYVPTASRRVRVRGYDQASLIAHALGEIVNLPYASFLLRSGQQRQVGQRREARLRQMHNAFRVAGTARIQGQRVLLIDDVLTTGASLEGAAGALKNAGARRVSGAVFAVASQQ